MISAIRSRRSIRKMRAEAPTREIVETILEAATWAPNHHLTEPWRFVVLAGDERRNLGEKLSEALESSIREDQRREQILQTEREKPLSAPVIIAMVFCPREKSGIVPQEEIASAGASLQNALLAAHSLGLGTLVRTGRHAYSENIKKYLGMKENESLLGFVYLGFPAESTYPSKRTPITEKIEWRGL